MKITDIYKKYLISINLQEHMFRVAAVASIICDNLQRVAADKNLIVKAALLHDMGNILKFNFSRLDLLDDEDKNRVDELKQAQKQFIEKYGRDTDEATLKIIKEVTPDSLVANLCENSHWELVDKFLNSDFWDRKIVCYSDMRVGPFGVIKLDDRFSDLEKRRPEEKDSLETLCQQAAIMEKEIQGVVKINLQDIDDEMIKIEVEGLGDFEL